MAEMALSMKIFFFLLLSILTSSSVMARCVNLEPKIAYAYADAVVLVKLRAVKIQENVAHMETEVLQSWKSKATDDTNILIVFSGLEEEPYPFINLEGETHILYLTKSSGPPEGFWTSNCMGNWPQSHKQATRHIRWLNRHGKKM